MKAQKQITVFSGVLIKNKKILMLQRFEEELPNAHLKWEFPGGKCDFGETPEEAIKREFFEETGTEIKVKELMPFIQTNYWEYPNHTQQTLCFLFLCEFIGEKEMKKKDHHVNDMAWFTAQEVKQLDSLPGTEQIIHLLEEKYPILIS